MTYRTVALVLAWVFLIGGIVVSSPAANAADREDAQWEALAKHWIQTEFQPSTLTPQQQLAELRWFRDAAKPYRGMNIYVVSERIDTHIYEAKVLAKAFSELTGIHLVHETTGEDDLIRKLQAQITTGQNLYDAYVNDSDLIGYHYRTQAVYPISDYIKEEGKDITLPTLDIPDFIGLDFSTGPDGKLYQLPDQHFANLYWYRADWFARPDLKKRFKARYGYELNVPRNWTAYEDIADFFTNHVKEIDGQRVWGHMDYGGDNPSLGWRISDAWLAMAGMSDPGLPFGFPVDDWGIRVKGCNPVGATVARGGALDGPAAIYAVTKFVDWLDRYAPPEAKTINFTDSGAKIGQGHIAQQIFWYTAFVPAVTKPGLPVMNPDGTPKWRVAPSPRGAYWQKGMKSGYQDAGSWTLLRNTPAKRREAAWLYAQFTVSKTVSLRKTLVGLTPIRKSDIYSEAMTKAAPKLGGLVEFYRSKARKAWTPTGTNVPDYPRLSTLWWHHISEAVQGIKSVPEVMHELAVDMDQNMADIGQTSTSPCRPILNPIRPESYWLNEPGSPKPKRDEHPQGITESYKQSLQEWDQ